MSDPTVVAAIVAAVISLIVALIGYFVNYSTIKQNQQQFDQQLQRQLTEKLYEKRLEAYPLVFEITDGLRGSYLFDESVKTQELLKLRDHLLEWNKKHGFVMSDKSISAFYKLRSALKLSENKTNKPSTEVLEKIFLAKNHFRSMLRNDVNLLYVEERKEQI